MAFRVDDGVALDALGFLARIIADRVDQGPPFSVAFATWVSMMAAVGSGSRPLAVRHCSQQCLMDAVKHAVAAPFPEVVVNHGVRWKVPGQLLPLAAGAIDVADGIENLAHVGHAQASVRTRRWEHRLDDAPLLIADIARIATVARLVRLAMIVGPHGSPLQRAGRA